MSTLENLAANRAARMLSIVKGFNDNDIEKANVGDMKVGPDGVTRIYTQLPSGKFDWRRVKKEDAKQPNKRPVAQPKKDDKGIVIKHKPTEDTMHHVDTKPQTHEIPGKSGKYLDVDDYITRSGWKWDKKERCYVKEIDGEVYGSDWHTLNDIYWGKETLQGAISGERMEAMADYTAERDDDEIEGLTDKDFENAESKKAYAVRIHDTRGGKGGDHTVYYDTPEEAKKNVSSSAISYDVYEGEKTLYKVNDSRAGEDRWLTKQEIISRAKDNLFKTTMTLIPKQPVQKKQVPDFTPKIPDVINKLTRNSDMKEGYVALGKDIMTDRFGDDDVAKLDAAKNYMGSYYASTMGDDEMIRHYAWKLGKDEAERASKTDTISAMKRYYEQKASKEEEVWRKEQNDAYWEGPGAKRKKELEQEKDEIKSLIASNYDSCSKSVKNILGISSVKDAQVDISMDRHNQSATISLGNSFGDITISRRDKSYGMGQDDWQLEFNMSSMNISDDAESMSVLETKSKIMSEYAKKKNVIENAFKIGVDMQMKLYKQFNDIEKELTTDHSED